MAKHRTHRIEFKRQIAQESLAGETLHGLAKRHDICRNLIRVWVQKYEAGDFDEDAATRRGVESGGGAGGVVVEDDGMRSASGKHRQAGGHIVGPEFDPMQFTRFGRDPMQFTLLRPPCLHANLPLRRVMSGEQIRCHQRTYLAKTLM